jgi:hypothetical protein
MTKNFLTTNVSKNICLTPPPPPSPQICSEAYLTSYTIGSKSFFQAKGRGLALNTPPPSSRGYRKSRNIFLLRLSPRGWFYSEIYLYFTAFKRPVFPNPFLLTECIFLIEKWVVTLTWEFFPYSAEFKNAYRLCYSICYINGMVLD